MTRVISEEPEHLQYLLSCMSEEAFSVVMGSHKGNRSLDALLDVRLAVEMKETGDEEFGSFYGTLARIGKDVLVFENVMSVPSAGRNVTGRLSLRHIYQKTCRMKDISGIYLAREFSMQ